MNTAFSPPPNYTQRTAWFLVGVVLIATSILYWQGLHNALVFDDFVHLLQGTLVQDYASVWPLRVRWLSYGSIAWLYQAFPENWALQRGFNMLFHLATVIAAFWFYQQVFTALAMRHDQPESMDRVPLVAASGAACFALSPVAVYAAAYMMQRSIVMATFFSLLALGLFVHGLVHRKPFFFVLATLGYLLAISAKEHAVLLPLAAGLVYYLLEGIDKRRLIRAILPLCVVTVVAAVIFYSEYGTLVGTVFDRRSEEFVALLVRESPAVAHYPHLLSIINEAALFFRYILVWIVPVPAWMSIDMRVGFPLQILSWQLLGVLALTGWIVAGVLLLRRRDNLATAGLAMLMPLSLYPTEFATVWIQDPFVLYRSYLWMVFLPLSFWAVHLRWPRIPYRPLFGAFLILSAWGTHNRIASFASDITVWSDAVAKLDPQAPKVGSDGVLLNLGRALQETKQCKESIPYFDRADQLNPLSTGALINRSASHTCLGDVEKALNDLELAVQRDASDPIVRFNLGGLLLSKNQLDRALEEFKIAQANLGRHAHSMGNHLLLRMSEVHERMGRLDMAMTYASQALDIRKTPEAFAQFGDIYMASADYVKAIESYTRALDLNPKAIMPRTNRAASLFNLGRSDEALADAQQALYLGSKHPLSYAIAVESLKRKHNWSAALKILEQQVREKVDAPRALYQHADLLARQGRQADAAREFASSCKAGFQPACSRQ